MAHGKIMSKIKQSFVPTRLLPGMSLAGPSMWHYTIGAKLPPIGESGALLPIPTPGAPRTERPVVWVSQQPEWEPTAAKGWWDPVTQTRRTLTKPETQELGAGLFRFKLREDQPIHTIHGFKAQGRITPKNFAAIWKEGLRQGAKPEMWFVSFEPIPLSDIERIEAWDGSQWVDDLSEVSGFVFEDGILAAKQQPLAEEGVEPPSKAS